MHDSELEMDMMQIIETNRKWMEQRRTELLAKEAARDRLAQECDSIRRELDLMVAWLDNVTGKQGTLNENISADVEKVKQEEIVPSAKAQETEPEEKGDRELRGDRLRDEVAAILLKVYPKALYYRDILDMLQQKGYKVSGKDPGLNLIAHLTHDDRFERGEKRGVYVLAANYANK